MNHRIKFRIHPWPVVIFILLIVLASCKLNLPGIPSLSATPTITTTPTPTPLPLSPTIIETVPPLGSQIPLQSLLTIYFSEKMDRTSVETGLSADFPGGFIFSWVDDSTLTLAPRSAMPTSARVTFTLAASAHSTSGLPLLSPISLSYQTPAPLRVSQVLPAAQSEAISPDSAVVVSFTQPVVPLGADPALLPAGFTLDPSTPGQGEWLNTSTYIFHAEPSLSGGVQYSVHVNPALVSTSGMPLDATGPNLSWVFSTSLPRVEHILGVSPSDQPSVSSTPASGQSSSRSNRLRTDKTDLLPDSQIEIAFNQPMEKASVEASFSFTGLTGNIAGSFEWNDKFSLMTFKPAAMLERDATYTVALSGQARSKGGVTLGTDSNASFHTIPAFAVQATSFPNGETRPYGEGITITFTAPLAEYNDAELRDLVTSDPKRVDGYSYIRDADLHNVGGFLPGRHYSLTFSSHLKDRYGQELGQDYVFSFTEPNAQPDLQPVFYSNELFTLPGDPTISVQAVNLDTLTISRGSMSLDDFIRTQSDPEFNEKYSPDDLQTWTVYPDMPLNDNQTFSVSLSDVPLVPGFYYANIESPDARNYSDIKRTLVVSNVNLTFKIGATEALLWAVDWRTQTPVRHMPFTLYNSDGASFLNATTDEKGLWRGQISLDDKKYYQYGAYAILGQPGDDQFGMAMINWNAGVEPWFFGLWTNVEGPHPQAYLYTDRPIYRPGDTVHFRGIVNQLYDGRYSGSGLDALTITWSDPNGKIGEQQAELSVYGSFNGDFSLPANAIPGDYSFSIEGDEQRIYGGYLYFKVADYRKPEINFSVKMNPQVAKSGQPLTALIDAEYFFGGPVADLSFSWRLYSETSYFYIPQFTTGLQASGWLPLGNDVRFGNVSREGQGRTNADGTFTIPLNDIKFNDTSVITLEVTASESGGFPVSARASATVHPEKFYIGVRPHAWVGQAGTDLGFDLLTLDWEKRPDSRSLNVVFEKVRWERQGTGNDYYDITFTPIYTPVDSESVTTTEDGHASVTFTPLDAGTYVLDVTSGDAHTQALVWVGGGEGAVWPNLPFQQLQLTASQENYKPGETAQVFIPNPFNAPALALLTTERSTFKSVEVVDIPVEGYTFNRPLTNADAPNIYVSATLLGPDGVDFRQGYIDLLVDPAALTLNVEVKATPAKAKPGDTLNLDLTVTDSDGRPVQGEFSLTVVDLAVLALSDPNSEDIVPAFYDVQPLGITSGLTAAVYAHRVIFQPGGGGGGGDEGAILTLRSKFPDTAYWKADIITDAQGQGHVTLTLPDNLTTWQVDTRGLTSDTRVGQARLQVVSTKDLLIRPQTQRFFVAGDHAELAAMVNNNTNQALDATVGLQVSGLQLDDPAKARQTLRLPANGSVRVVWSGLVLADEFVDPVFSVNSGNLRDASRPVDGAIPVLRYSAPQTFSTAGILTEASTRQEIIAVPRSFQPLGGNLKVELSPSMAAVILDSLKTLEAADTPWSSEQIVSSLLPNVVTYMTLQASGLDEPDLTERLQENLRIDLDHLLAYQSEDGGFKWTLSSSKNDPYLTAYVLFSLEQVAESGLDVGNLDIAAAMEIARTYLFSLESYYDNESLNTSSKLNRVAFILYVLENTGGLESLADMPELLYGVDYRKRLDPWAKAFLSLTLSHRSTSDEHAAILINDLEATAIRSSTGAHWESTVSDWMNPATPLFTTAIVINALSERDPSTPMVADAVRYMALQQDAGGRWASSYETTWVILAMDKYMHATGELGGNFSFSAILNGASLAQGQASGPQNLATVMTETQLSVLNLSGANSLLVNRLGGPGSLYYRAALSIDRPVETVQAFDGGIAVSRQFMDCSGETCLPVTSYRMKPDLSGRVSVRLTLTIPHDAYYLMVQDYIPAGTDILDSSVKTSQQGEQDLSVQVPYDPSDPFSEGWGWWYFNRPQLYADHILWSADYLPAGTYELTYTIIPSLAGQYRILPTHAWQAYFPEVQGTSAGAVFEIKP